jgi:hypothetical protein
VSILDPDEREQQLAAVVAGRIRKAAADMRVLCAQLERRADQVSTVGGGRNFSYTILVASIQHDIRDAFFTACLDQLVLAAGEADQVRTARLAVGVVAGDYAAKEASS